MQNIMHDICIRTNNELYIGVVGTVRTGKSTFIKKFVESKILPYVRDEATRNLIVDEIPQSSAGRNIMTVEPKFIPSSSVEILLDKETKMAVRLVDCVGYVINNSLGSKIDDKPRMVNTPWFEDEITFEDAAEIGTKKVIENHSNIGIVLTSDGSFGDFTRNDYELSEEKVIDKVKETKKPFIIILNTTEPYSERTKILKNELENKYNSKVIPLDLLNATSDDFDNILKESLYEFNVNEINIRIPSYISVLDDSSKIKKVVTKSIESSTDGITKLREVYKVVDSLKECDLYKKVSLSEIAPSSGDVEIDISVIDTLYDDILEDIIGEKVEDKGQFIEIIQDYKRAKLDYDQIEGALSMVRSTGYGIAFPKVSDMTLADPEIIKQGSRYGVKLKAIAPSIHMIQVDVDSSFEPIIGTEAQSKALIDNLLKDSTDDPTKVWSSEIFGRSLYDLVNDGIRAKLYMLPDNVQYKFKDTLQKVVNKGGNGIIAIVL